MSRLNLIPPDLLARREARRLLRFWAWRVGASVLLLGGLFFLLNEVAADRFAEVEQISGRYDDLQGRLRSAEDLILERDRLAERRAVIDLIRDEHPADAFLFALGEALTPDSYLTFLELRRCAPAGEETGDAPCRATLRIRGQAADHGRVGAILRGLGRAPRFADATLLSVHEPQRSGADRAVEFEITATLRESDE